MLDAKSARRSVRALAESPNPQLADKDRPVGPSREVFGPGWHLRGKVQRVEGERAARNQRATGAALDGRNDVVRIRRERPNEQRRDLRTGIDAATDALDLTAAGHAGQHLIDECATRFGDHGECRGSRTPGVRWSGSPRGFVPRRSHVSHRSYLRTACDRGQRY
jgi:hypothetical protein